MKREKILILPQIYDCGGDPLGVWFVYYSYRNPKSGKMKRFKIYEGFKPLGTEKQKRIHAEKLSEDFTYKLKNGWNPFDEQSEVIYSDDLIYAEVARNYGRIRKSNRVFNFYINRYMQNLNGVRPSTYISYKSKFRYFEKFLEINNYQDNDVTAFNSQMAKDFIEYLVDKRKLQSKTINEYVTILKSFYGYLVRETIVKENVFSNIKRRKSQTSKPQIYSYEIMAKITKEAEISDPQLLMAIKIIFNCLVRPGELRQLKISNFDTERGLITIPAQVAKTSKQRVVEIPDYLLDELRNKKIAKYPGNFYLIGSQDKPDIKMVSRNFLYRKYVKLKKRIDIPRDYILYAFKHTGMVELKRSGADWLEVRNQAGHSSLDQTIEYTTELMGQLSENIRKRAPRI